LLDHSRNSSAALELSHEIDRPLAGKSFLDFSQFEHKRKCDWLSCRFTWRGE